MPKHLLFLIDSIGVGGSERILSYIVNKLDRKRFKISLCFLSRPQFPYDLPEEIKLYYLNEVSEKLRPNMLASLSMHFAAIALNIRGFNHDRKRMTRDYREIKSVLKEYHGAGLALNEIIGREKPDLIISFRTYSNLIVLITKFLFRIKVPIFCSHRNHISERIKVLPFPSLYESLAKLLNKNADLHIAISNGVKEDLIANFKTSAAKTTVVYNGVDIEFVKEQSREPLGDETREALFNDSAFRIVTVGRLGEQKGHKYLLKAFKKLRSRINCRLIIVGQGKRRKYLESLSHKLAIHEDVHLLGWQKNPFKFMTHCDLFVLSSLWEGFANVIVEAMALGLPVISTDCPSGPSEILDGGRYGILVPIKDEDALEEAMLNVLTNGKLRMELSEKSMIRVRDFTVEKMLNDYENLFTEFVR